MKKKVSEKVWKVTQFVSNRFMICQIIKTGFLEKERKIKNLPVNSVMFQKLDKNGLADTRQGNLMNELV